MTDYLPVPLEFEFPMNGKGTWSVAVTGDLYRTMNLTYLGFDPELGAQGSPVTLGIAIDSPGLPRSVLNPVSALAEQDFYTDPAFVATADVPVPPINGPKSLYVFYNYIININLPYSVLIYKVSVTPPVSISSKAGSKRGYFS